MLPSIAYRLIDGNFLDEPFIFQNWNSCQTSFVDDAMKQTAEVTKTIFSFYHQWIIASQMSNSRGRYNQVPSPTK